MNEKTILIVLSVLLFTSLASAESLIQGHIIDKDSGAPSEGVLVEVFETSDHSRAIDSDVTDEKGFYNMTVSPGNYDVYVRIGTTNPSQSIYVQSGQIQVIDFETNIKSVQGQENTSNAIFYLEVTLAAMILLFIILDQLFFKRKRILKDLAAERNKLEEEIKEEKKAGGSVSELKKEKSQLEYMINLTRTKYHKRSINEESFREIIRDYQEKLIEVEAKIATLEGDTPKE